MCKRTYPKTLTTDLAPRGTWFVCTDLPSPGAGSVAIGCNMNDLIETVASHTGVTPDEMRSRRKSVPIGNARAIYCHVRRQLTGDSYPTIGRDLGLDHSTLVKSAKRLAADADLRTVAAAVLASTQTAKGDAT